MSDTTNTTNEAATELSLDQTDDVGGGNENSYNAGVQMGNAIGTIYQTCRDWLSERTYPAIAAMVG